MDAVFRTPEVILRHAEGEAEILACFPAMRQLRPHLTSGAELLERVNRQRAQNYRILAAWRGDAAVALAGYRLQENLIYGPFLYVDDLVTLKGERRGRLGERLLEAVADEARGQGCVRLVLDTGLDNTLAHRFYYRQGLLAGALHFGRPLT